MNKHGSGFKRLVLISFFLGEAEKKKDPAGDIIYGLEEPETSQHIELQSRFFDALKKLSSEDGSQIMITTHSPHVVKKLELENVRIVGDSASAGQNRSRVNKVSESPLLNATLNEIIYIAFGEGDTDYHDELYGFLDSAKLLDEFKAKQPPYREYLRENKDGEITKKPICMSEYIRHQIHHPENKNNRLHKPEELQESIKLMRGFLQSHQEDQGK